MAFHKSKPSTLEAKVGRSIQFKDTLVCTVSYTVRPYPKTK